MTDYIAIKQIKHPDLWDSYVEKTPVAEFSHLYGWRRVIQKTYGHKPVYLAGVHVRENREVVCGILPMFVFQSMAGERRLVSLPFVDTAGILADSKVIEHMLFNKAASMMKKTGCKAMDIRQDRPLWCSGRIEGFNINISTLKVGLKLTLGVSQQELKKRFKSKLRSQINRAVKNGLKAKTGKKELIDPFYRVFSRNMRDLGSPVHSRRFFEAVMEIFYDEAFISVVTHGRKPVAAGFMFRFKNEIKNPWASSLREFRPLSANMLLYWEMMRFSCNLGLARFDMGRSSRNASTFRFKQQWHPRVRQLYWYQWHKDLVPFKLETLNFPWLSRVPVTPANLVGPWIRRHISL